MVQEIKTMQDVTAFLESIAKEIGDYNPFADFSGFVDPATNQPVYTDEEAALRKRLLDDCFAVCGQQGGNFIYLFLVILQEARDNVAHLQSQLSTIENRKRKDYFAGCKTVADVKRRYLELALEHNFYAGGDKETIDRIQDEYAKTCDPIIMRTATSEENMFAQLRRKDGYIEIISQILILTGVKVETTGFDLIVTCSVYQSEIIIREAGLKYCKNNQVWYCPL